MVFRVIIVLLFIFPATLWIFVISKASSKVKSGSIVVSLFAIIVFPWTEESQLTGSYVRPAAAISKALFILSCPFTSEKSKLDSYE